MVGENIFYKDVFHKIAEELKVKKPGKNASRPMLEIAWKS